MIFRFSDFDFAESLPLLSKAYKRAFMILTSALYLDGPGFDPWLRAFTFHEFNGMLMIFGTGFYSLTARSWCTGPWNYMLGSLWPRNDRLVYQCV